MTVKETIDTIIARELTLPAEHVKRTRLAWNEDTVIHAVFAHRFATKIEELRNALEHLPIEQVAQTQQEIKAYRVALSLVTAKEL